MTNTDVVSAAVAERGVVPRGVVPLRKEKKGVVPKMMSLPQFKKLLTI